MLNYYRPLPAKYHSHTISSPYYRPWKLSFSLTHTQSCVRHLVGLKLKLFFFFLTKCKHRAGVLAWLWFISSAMSPELVSPRTKGNPSSSPVSACGDVNNHYLFPFRFTRKVAMETLTRGDIPADSRVLFNHAKAAWQSRVPPQTTPLVSRAVLAC